MNSTTGEFNHWWIQRMMNSTNDEFNKWWIQQMKNSTNDEFNNWWIQQLMNSTIDEFNNWWIQQLMNSTIDEFNNWWIQRVMTKNDKNDWEWLKNTKKITFRKTTMYSSTCLTIINMALGKWFRTYLTFIFSYLPSFLL